MKFTIITLALLASNAFAMDLTPNNDKEITDIMYVPEAGTTYVELGFDQVSTDETAKVVSTGLNYATSDSETKDLNLILGRAFEGNIFLFAELDYDLKAETDLTYGNGTTSNGVNEKTESKGLADPTLGARYRMVEQEDKGFLLDLNLTFSPKTGDSEAASTTQDGNNYRGGSAGSVGLNFGKKFNSVSFSIGADLTFNGSRDVKSLSTGNTLNIDSHTDFSISAISQFQPNKQMFFNVTLSYQSLGDYDQVSGSTTTSIDFDPIFSYGLAIGYRLSPNVAIRALYQGASLNREYTQGTTIIDEEVDLSRIGTFIQTQF
jgi:hypothetical protein